MVGTQDQMYRSQGLGLVCMKGKRAKTMDIYRGGLDSGICPSLAPFLDHIRLYSMPIHY